MPPLRTASHTGMVGRHIVKEVVISTSNHLFHLGNGYGMTVKSQKERNHWFQFFATQCLQSKNIGGLNKCIWYLIPVGLHWFAYQDKPYHDSTTGKTELTNRWKKLLSSPFIDSRGAFDHSYRWWPEMEEAFKMVFWHIGSLVDFFDKSQWRKNYIHCFLEYEVYTQWRKANKSTWN